MKKESLWIMYEWTFFRASKKSSILGSRAKERVFAFEWGKPLFEIFFIFFFLLPPFYFPPQTLTSFFHFPYERTEIFSRKPTKNWRAVAILVLRYFFWEKSSNIWVTWQSSSGSFSSYSLRPWGLSKM